MWRPQDKEAVLREVHLREWRARVGRKTVAFFRRSLGALAKHTVAALLWLKEQAAKTAQEVETSQLLSQRYDKLLHLGEVAYNLFRAGHLSWEALEPLCREIEGIDQRLEAAKKPPLQVMPSETAAAPEAPLNITASQ